MGLLDSFRSKVHVFLRRQDHYPGNVVEGYVQIVVSSPMSFVAIRVEASGEEYARIERTSSTTNSDGSTSSTTSTYTDSKLLFRELITLVGEMKCTGNRRAQTAPPGCYTYPFAFQLPVSLPPSVYLDFGTDGRASISYVVHAYVDIPNGFDSNGRQEFRVLSSLPKRQWVDRRPMNDRVQWDVTCCCCIKKGKVSAAITSDRTVFAADRDRVVLDVDLDNSLGEEPIESVEVDLLNNRSCTVGYDNNSRRFSVGGVKLLTAIPAGGKGHVQASIPIPRDANPSVQGYILACSYSIAVELHIPWASNPTLVNPAALGSTVDETDRLPLQSLYARQYAEVVSSGPESYYAPPPSTVYTYNPVPLPTVLANGAVETQYAAPAFAVQPA